MAHRKADATVSAHDAVVVVPSDVTEIPVTRGLWVGVTGNITVRMVDRSPPSDPLGTTTVTFTAVPVGVLPIQVDKVMASGTTASSLLALY